MEDTIVTLRYTDLGRARRALHELERVDHEGRLHVRGATLVQRSGQGGIDAPAAARDGEGHYLPPGGSVGERSARTGLRSFGFSSGVVMSAPKSWHCCTGRDRS